MQEGLAPRSRNGVGIGDETGGTGDLNFIPQSTIYGPTVASGNRFAAVSIFAPYFNDRKENIEWMHSKS